MTRTREPVPSTIPNAPRAETGFRVSGFQPRFSPALATALVLIFVASSLTVAGPIGRPLAPWAASHGPSAGSAPLRALHTVTASPSAVLVPSSALALSSPQTSGVALGSRSNLAPPSVTPATPVTPTNWYVQNEEWFSSAVQAGVSPSDLLATGFAFGPEFNYTAGSSTAFLPNHGILGISTTTNGGVTWATQWPGRATAWSTSGSPSYLDFFNVGGTGGLPNYWRTVGFPGWTSIASVYPTAASNPDGSDMLVAAPYGNFCRYDYTVNTACTTQVGANLFYSNFTESAPSGIAVVRSTNHGVTWGTPVPVNTHPWFQPWYYNGNCTAFGTTPELFALPANETLSMSLALSGATTAGKNQAYLAWTVAQNTWAKQALTCGTNGLYYNFGPMNFFLEISSSLDGGATWSAPVTAASASISSANLLAGSFTLAPLVNDVHLAVGPAPNFAVTAAYSDYGNASAVSMTDPSVASVPIATITNATSTTWGKPGDTTVRAIPVQNSQPDWLYNGTASIITSDNWSASPHKGSNYLVWNDNRTTHPGTPSIYFSGNSGSGWSTPVRVSSGASGLRYFDPAVSIQPNGTIWIDYYGVVPSDGYYRVYGVFSTDGGATWSGEFAISDASGMPGSAPTPQVLEGQPAIVGNPSGAYALWSDCRAAICNSGNWTAMLASVHPVQISATGGAGVSATVTVGGSTATYGLPIHLGWETNASVTVGVTGWVTAPNGTWIDEFSSFSGAAASTSNPASFTYLSGNLVAHYTAVPGSWIAGTLTPAVAGATVTIVDPVRGAIAATLTSASGHYAFNVTVPGGQAYTVSATAPKYTPSSQTIPTTQFRTATVDFVLPKIAGWIAGSVSTSTGVSGLAGAVVTINGTPVSNTNFNRTTGKFNVTEPWGTYYLNVSETGYLSIPSSFPLIVNPGSTAVAFPQLKGAWINGTVSPGVGVTVTLIGPAGTTTATLSIQGTYATFNVAIPSGTYEITAHKQGYSSFDYFWTLPLGGAKSLAINLTNRGYITGFIHPASNNGNVPFITVNGVQSSVTTTGYYNVSLKAQAALVPVVATLAGYNDGFANVTIGAGNVTWQNFSLKIHTQGCQGAACCPPVNCTTTPPPPPPTFSTLAIVGIGIAIVLVAVVAAVLLLMRKGKGGAAESETAEPAAEDAPTEPSVGETAGESPPNSGS